jgi:hypothetical protein
MQLHELVSLIERSHPEMDRSSVARIALILSLSNPDLDVLQKSDEFESQCREINNRLLAATDQNNAVAYELDQLASSDPCEFSPDHLWTLIRAIKVQSQFLSLYLDGVKSPALDLQVTDAS